MPLCTRSPRSVTPGARPPPSPWASPRCGTATRTTTPRAAAAGAPAAFALAAFWPACRRAAHCGPLLARRALGVSHPPRAARFARRRGLALTRCGARSQPCVLQPEGAHPQVRAGHVPPVLPRVRQGHRLREGAWPAACPGCALRSARLGPNPRVPRRRRPDAPPLRRTTKLPTCVRGARAVRRGEACRRRCSLAWLPDALWCATHTVVLSAWRALSCAALRIACCCAGCVCAVHQPELKIKHARGLRAPLCDHSTVTDLARLRGWSTLWPRSTVRW
jgi:hypothetical protein